MKKRFTLGAVVLTALVTAAPSFAALVSLNSIKDNTLYEDVNGELSNGVGVYLFAGSTGAFGARRAVLAFNVAAAIPAGATINSASLRLNMSRCGPSCGLAVQTDLRRLQADWGEGASNAGTPGGAGTQAQTNDATWVYNYYNSSSWSNVGGDFSGTVTASTNVSTTGLYSWSSSQLIGDVQSMLDSPAGNYGWVLIGDESQLGGAKRYDSRENTAPGAAPVLTIEYTPIPEPATLFFVGLGLVAMNRSRRK